MEFLTKKEKRFRLKTLCKKLIIFCLWKLKLFKKLPLFQNSKKIKPDKYFVEFF